MININNSCKYYRWR